MCTNVTNYEHKPYMYFACARARIGFDLITYANCMRDYDNT
jgi:hypothetical protein